MSNFRKEGTSSLRHMWVVVAIMTLIQVIVSLVVASKNSSDIGGYKSAAFIAIWCMFLVICFTYNGYKIVKTNKNSSFTVGFVIGIACMLCQLFFMVGVLYIGLGLEAYKNNWTTSDSDQAYGAFAIMNSIIYLVWSVILIIHRSAIMRTDAEEQAIRDLEREDSDSMPTYNQVLKPDEDGSEQRNVNGAFAGDDTEL